MLYGTGRPRKACNTCKSLKVANSDTDLVGLWYNSANWSQIGCSGERPSCPRCLRLKRTCVYGYEQTITASPPVSRNLGSTRDRPPLATRRLLQQQKRIFPRETSDVNPNRISPTSRLAGQRLSEEHYHGIPKALVLALVQVYFENLYNAKLLLHKRLFLESLEAGTSPAHIVLSVCASAAK